MLRSILALAFALSLSACMQKVTEPISKAIADSIGGMFSKGIACAFVTTFTNYPDRIKLEIEDKEFKRIQALIIERKITSGKHFWQRLGTSDTQALQQWLQTGYDQLPADSITRQQKIKYFQAMFASGMLYITRQDIQAGKYVFFQNIGKEKNNTTTYNKFAIGITLLNSANTETKAVGSCK